MVLYSVNSPWYVTNVSLQNELKIATINKQLSHSILAFTLKRLTTPIASSFNFTPTTFHLPGNSPRRLNSATADLETYSTSDKYLLS